MLQLIKSYLSKFIALVIVGIGFCVALWFIISLVNFQWLYIPISVIVELVPVVLALIALQALLWAFIDRGK